MIAIKKDFVPENTISYCNNRPLSSGKAYFLQDAQGNIHYAGKQCAEQNSHTNLTQIPDLTRALIANVAGHAGGHAGGHGGGHGGPNLGNHRLSAIRYLLLREEKLQFYPFIQHYTFTPLRNLYNNYLQNHNLTNQEVNQVLNHINNSININPKLSLQNLETCYAYDYILGRAIANINNNTFCTGLLTYLQQHCNLSSNQIQGLQNWLNHLPQMQDCHLRNF